MKKTINNLGIRSSLPEDIFPKNFLIKTEADLKNLLKSRSKNNAEDYLSLEQVSEHFTQRSAYLQYENI